jgi:uncharacterized integral membrane protein
MSKAKVLGLLLAGVLLAIFLVENWHYPEPPIQFLGFRFLPLPHALVMLSCFALGFLGGYATHAWRMKQQKTETPSPSASTE